MKGVNLAHVVYYAAFNHFVRAAVALFSVLENESDIARRSVFGKNFSHAEHDCHVGVVTAGVHVFFGAKRQTRLFRYRQCVHIAAQSQHFAAAPLPRYIRIKSRVNAFVLQAEFAEPLLDIRACFVLATRKLGYAVQIAPHFRCIGKYFAFCRRVR